MITRHVETNTSSDPSIHSTYTHVSPFATVGVFADVCESEYAVCVCVFFILCSPFDASVFFCYNMNIYDDDDCWRLFV